VITFETEVFVPSVYAVVLESGFVDENLRG
jgi:hypothetical protein